VTARRVKAVGQLAALHVDAGAEDPQTAPDSPAEPVALRRKVITGVAWKLLGHGFAQITRSLVGILLARLLSPSDFGLAAMALVFVGIAGIFTDLSLGSALVQRKVITEEDRSTAFWTTLGVGTLITLIGVGLSPFIADFFSTPKATPLIAATCSMVFLASLGLTQTALLTRELKFRSLELRNLFGALVGAALAIPIALAGFGAWAIISQAIGSTAVSSMLVWRLSPWRPRFIFSTQSLRTLGSFGVKTMVSQFLGFVSLYADNLLVGRYLGALQLGVYSVAYNVMFVPVMRVAQPVQDVVFAAFAKLQNEPARLRDAWMRGTVLVSSLNAAAFLGMFVVAPDFVPVVLGAKWHAAVPVLQFLSLAGVSQSVQSLNWATMQSIGRAGTSLRLRLFSVPLILVAFAVGLRWGVVGVAGLYAAARFIILPVSVFVTGRALGYPLRLFVRNISSVYAHCIIMAACVYAARIGLVHSGFPAAPRLVVLVLFGTLVYVGIIAWREPNLIKELRGFVARS
jgi:O-antigen/teichoic acid export membrane protein